MSRFLTSIRNSLPRRCRSSPRASSTLAATSPRNNNSEPHHRYEPGGYHPVSVGEIYNQRYRTVRKLGWGLYSVVWLVEDTQVQRLGAMKILVGDLAEADKKGGWDELGVLKILQETNPQSSGYHHVCQLLDSFTHQGPNGSHTCLVLEPMSISVLDIYRALPGAMPLPLLKRVCKHVLRALCYLHEECGIIHTDIKGDNILMAGPPPEEGQLNIKLDKEYLLSTTFKLSDFGAANLMSNRFAEVIQPESLRSPEVIIGAKWDTKVDIWNFGCLVYEFARGSKLFDPHWANEKNEMNPTQTHLSQISGLCGDFSPAFLDGGKKSKLYFDAQGSLLKGAGQYSITLGDLLARAGHLPEDVSEISQFLSLMLTIDPKVRWSASRLLGHSWITNVE